MNSLFLALAVGAALVGTALAQGRPPASPAAPSVTPSLPAGTGAGIHSPNSPYAPLPQRGDVVPWPLLTDIQLRDGRKGPRPVFNAEQMALHLRSQRVQGFMMPLEAGEKQSHFLLTSVPLTCAFCTPGGPESMVEVRTKTPVRYGMEPVVVEGRFQVLSDDPYGLYYRMTDAVPVK